MAAEWSNLLPEILEYIAQKYMSTDIYGFAMFSCVCSSWHKAATAVKHSPSTFVDQLPLLLLLTEYDFDSDDRDDDEGDNVTHYNIDSDTEKKDDNVNYEGDNASPYNIDEKREDDDDDSVSRPHPRNIWDIGNNTYYNVILPQAYNKCCYGTGCGRGGGWILTVGIDREIHLINPLTKAQLSLPSYLTLPQLGSGFDPKDHEFKDENDLNEWIRNCLIHRSLVVKDQDQDRLLVIVVYGSDEWIAVASPGDSKWTHIEAKHIKGGIGPINCAIDMAYCPTSNIILFLLYGGMLAYWDMHLTTTTMTTTTTTTTTSDPALLTLVQYLEPPYFFPRIIPREHKYYILESIDGDILMVKRVLIEDNDRNRAPPLTHKFEVYRLVDNQTNEWKELKDLGDVALFVGNSPATSVKASRFADCKPNSIYFNDDNGMLSIANDPARTDMGVFDMSTAEIQPFIHIARDCYSDFALPVWLVPCL